MRCQDYDVAENGMAENRHTEKQKTLWELLEREIMSWKKHEKGENMGKTMKQDCSHMLVSTLDSEWF